MNKFEFVRVLIISRISGSITQEESLQLKTLMAKSFKCRRLYRRIKRILSQADAIAGANAVTTVIFEPYPGFTMEDGFYYVFGELHIGRKI